MTAERAASVLVVVVCLWAPLRAAEWSVLCRLNSPCVLPCSFDPGPQLMIQWYNLAGETTVHLLNNDMDQLEGQQLWYKGRTALFKDQISKGNASLLLSAARFADSGRYKCYTSTILGNNGDFVNLDVHAPVGDVLLEEDGETLKCESRDIFPKPSVSWSPPSDLTPSVTLSRSELFSVSSSVNLTRRPLEEHSCNISSEHSWRSATFRRNDSVVSSGSSTELLCAETEGSIKTLTWTFNRTQTILQRNGSNTDYNPDWESRLEKVPGSELVLKRLSPEQQGLYSCLLITDLSTSLTVTEVSVEERARSGALAGGIVGIVLVVTLLLLVSYFCIKRIRKQKNTGTITQQQVPE